MPYFDKYFLFELLVAFLALNSELDLLKILLIPNIKFLTKDIQE
jgi:hypothetical protein